MTIENIHQRLLKHRKKEKQILAAILQDLHEIYRTRYFAKLGHDSLFRYLIKELGYSEGSAARRVKALKICKNHPELKPLMQKGEMSLRNFTLLGDALPKLQNKEEIIQKAKTLSSKNLELEILKDTQQEKIRPERLCRVSSQRFRLSVNLSAEGAQNFAKIRGLHRNRKKGMGEIAEEAFELYLQQYSPEYGKAKIRKKSHKSLTKALKNQVWKRAEGKCQYQNCSSTHLLEVEHIIPKGRGGNHDLSNLALFCRSHNTLSAIEAYELKQMEMFLR